MATITNRSRVQYRITAATESIPQRGDVLHACGLTNWHLVVRKILRLSPHEDGTMTLEMVVDRSDIGTGEGSCTLCGMTWLGNVHQPS